jgi:hypothetical protein
MIFAFGLIFMLGMVVTMIAEAFAHHHIGLRPLGYACLAMAGTAITWTCLANMLLRRSQPISATQIEEINAVLTGPGHEEWASIVGGWYKQRLLTDQDYRRVMRAEKMELRLMAKDEERAARDQAACEERDLLLSGPIGAALAREQLERGTALATSAPSVGARL